MKIGREKKLRYLSPNCFEIEELCYKLAQKIKRSKYKFDIIVGIGRGGWIPARYIADYLGNIMNIASVKVEHYRQIAKPGVAKITQPVSAPVKGKRVLLVDDVADTGDSLKLAKEHLLKKGAKEVKVACMHFKPWSTFTPDFYVKITSSWVIYPWMRKENLEELKKKGKNLRDTGIPEKEIKKILRI